jgi:energy-coupling factor transporter ATP-binding protein EcfA2
VLLCDEPTSLQDRAQSAWLLERLRAWRRATGGTLVLATQRRAEVELCDRLLLLQASGAAACGAPSQVLECPEARELLAPLAATSGAPAARSQGGEVAGSVPVAEWRGVGRRFAAGGGFRGVNLVLRAGDRLGITGPNGCGKSLLLAMGAGLLEPTEGRCHLHGRPLCSRGAPDLDHGAVLLAPQFPEYFFTRTTVGAEIALDPALAGRTAEVLAAAGLPGSWTGRNPHDLSSGERRRLAVALTVLSERRLLLLDEPTAGLDLAGRRRLLALLQSIPPAAALVVASHDAEFLMACGCSTYELGPTGLIREAARGEDRPLAPAEPLV